MSRTDERVVFYYDIPAQPELAVEITDHCAEDNTYSIYLGGLTPMATDIAISNFFTGETLRFSNPMNQEAGRFRRSVRWCSRPFPG